MIPTPGQPKKHSGDGDYWHASPAKAELDHLRYNDLDSAGWQQLRFTERQIRKQTAKYCIPKIEQTIKKLGGLEEEGKFMPRKIDPDAPAGTYQPSLFDSTQKGRSGLAGFHA